MRIKTAIMKLQALAQKDPKLQVSFRRLKPKKKKRPSKRALSESLRAWAKGRCEKKGYFTFLEACQYYDRIGGSAGTTTVWHRLCDIGARNCSPDLAEKHLRARYVVGKEAGIDMPIKEMIDRDPTFAERYNAARRQAVERGGLAPAPLSEVSFRRSHGKKGQFWIQAVDPDRDRQLRIEVRPQPGYNPPATDN